MQMLATVVVLWVGKAARVISFPDFDNSMPRKVKPWMYIKTVQSFPPSTSVNSIKTHLFTSIYGHFCLPAPVDFSSTSSVCGESNNRTLWDQKAEVRIIVSTGLLCSS